MKQKSHSGLKKRVKVKGKKLYMQKSAKNHLLVNKSKSQKKSFKGGMPVSTAHEKNVRKLLPHAF